MGKFDELRRKAEDLADKAKPKAEELKERGTPLAQRLRDRAEHAGRTIKSKTGEVRDNFREGYSEEEPPPTH